MTLIETLITIGILATLAVVGLGNGLDGYENALARSNTTSALWTVLDARAKAMNGICVGTGCNVGSIQTATITSSQIIMFTGLSGFVAYPQDFFIGTGSSTSELRVNEEGQISLISR